MTFLQLGRMILHGELECLPYMREDILSKLLSLLFSVVILAVAAISVARTDPAADVTAAYAAWDAGVQ